jgi:bifunctional non-homologous end joining protein LigD
MRNIQELGLTAYVKTSGEKRVSLLVPIERRYSFEQTRNFVHAVGKVLAKDSEVIVSEFRDTKKIWNRLRWITFRIMKGAP